MGFDPSHVDKVRQLLLGEDPTMWLWSYCKRVGKILLPLSQHCISYQFTIKLDNCFLSAICCYGLITYNVAKWLEAQNKYSDYAAAREMCYHITTLNVISNIVSVSLTQSTNDIEQYI